MSDLPDRFLRMTRRFKAPIERVYKAWLDPSVTRQWLFTSPASDSNDTRIEARVGGKWTVTDVRDGISYTAEGEYLELDPPHRIVFTFGMMQFSPKYDTITIALSEDGDETVMVFTQSGVGIAEELANPPASPEETSEHGWNLMFLALAQAVER
jgi:uncharacterized protein YndB with AHSA1/START domain